MDGLRSLSNQPDTKRPTIQEPPQNQTQGVFDLYIQVDINDALDQTLELLVELKNSATLYNILGAANYGLGKLDQAVDALKKHFLLIQIVMMPIIIWVML